MAHADEIESHLGTLIQEHISSHRPADVNRCKRLALKTLAGSNYVRTSQFEVNARLEGFAEKFRILNKEDMADALDKRVDELSQLSITWAPEALSLLLHLSNRPTEKSNPENLAKAASEKPSAPLAWSPNGIEESDNEDSELWKDIDYAADSSSEDSSIEYVRSDQPVNERLPNTPLTEDLSTRREHLILPSERNGLDYLTERHYWRCQAGLAGDLVIGTGNEARNKLLLTEVEVVREVLFMLLGLPTTIYSCILKGTVNLSQQILIRHVSSDSTVSLLDDFAVIGGELDLVRGFANKKESVPLVQVFQAALGQRLHVIESTLNIMQARIIDDRQNLSLSLLGLYEEVCRATRPIRHLPPVLRDVYHLPEPQKPFTILECLFKKACFCHSVADLEAYEYVGSIFFECFRAYLKPIRLWMETGQVHKHDQVMFVKRNLTDVSHGSIWQDQFSLINNADGALRAPRFLHFMTDKIYNAGKSIHFLNQLGVNLPALAFGTHDDNMMSFDAVCRAADPSMLSSFPELFDAAFDRWIASRHDSSSSVLRAQLDKQCGLQKSLDAFEYIYFFKNSVHTDIILTPVFERIDNGKRTWNDPFVLSELFQGAFAAVPCIDAANISVQSTNLRSQGNRPAQPAKHSSMSLLEDLCITYTLPWPVANIIRPSSLSQYQRIFIFLAQHRRARYLLHQHKLPDPGNSRFSKSQLDQIYNLRSRLLYFTNVTLTHLTLTVLDPCVVSMRAQMERAEDIDTLITVHTTCMNKIEHQCLLTKEHASLKQAIVSVLDLTVLFADLLTKPGNMATVHGSQPKSLPRRTLLSSSSSSDGEDEDPVGSSSAGLSVNATFSADDRGKNTDEELRMILSNLAQLFCFITASVQSMSKADGAVCWEIFASNLAAGLGGGR